MPFGFPFVGRNTVSVGSDTLRSIAVSAATPTTEGDFGANAFQLCGRTFGPEADHFFGQGVTGHCGTSIEIRMAVARLDADDSDIARERIAARVS
jgi:hypothetical protein